MAWISVHESIDGPKLRNLYKTLKCSKFEAVGILNYLWMWGLNNADKNGYVRFADEDDVAEGIGRGGNGSNLDAAQILKALIETEWIEKEDGEPLRLHDWNFWQAEKFAYEKRLKDHRDRQRRYAAKKAEKAKTENTDAATEKDETALAAQKTTLSIPASKPETKAGRGKDYSNSFRELWELYPRKDGKSDAYAQYQKRLKEGYSESELYAAAKKYAEKIKRDRTDTKYVRKGANFFRTDGDFRDYLPKPDEEVHDYGDGMEEYPDWFSGGWNDGY